LAISAFAGTCGGTEVKMKLDKKGETLIVRLDGELDHHYASQIRESIDAAVITGNIKKIIFDFTKVGFMDSSGIGTIMGRFKLMQTVGGSVCAFGVSERLDKLITMCGIKKIINIYESEHDATKGVG
jgi:stage II sporulation protein AA (anti-sigma F factor antagonist)